MDNLSQLVVCKRKGKVAYYILRSKFTFRSEFYRSSKSTLAIKLKIMSTISSCAIHINLQQIMSLLRFIGLNFHVCYSRGIVRSDSVWDKLVFRKVREGMGGRLRIMVVGSAPLAGNVLTFARCALGCLIVEGYGQTECTAPVTLTVQGDHVPEHVGPPVACCKVKVRIISYYISYENKGSMILISNT